MTLLDDHRTQGPRLPGVCMTAGQMFQLSVVGDTLGLLMTGGGYMYNPGFGLLLYLTIT